MKKYLYIIFYTLLFNSIYSQCDDSILLLTMEDSWGDGWNGNTFCINAECATLPFGSTGTHEFCVDLSIENMITCGGGSWQSEVFWTLSDSDGTALVTGGAPFEGCVGGSCENEITESFEFNDNGQIRDYYLYRPNSIQDNAPLVFVLHGYSGSAGGIMGYSGMNEVAAEHGFAVCYPQGISDQSEYNFWNVGYAFHQNQTVDDVAFLSSLADYLQNEYGFDSQKIFVTGMSNGGDMSYMLACQASDVFRAIAPVAGCMMETIYDTCDSSPVPVLEIHGTNDNVTLWDGDMQNNDGWGAYYSIPEGIDFWVETNSCMSSENIFLPNTNTSDGSYIINHRYFDCTDNTEVWLYEVVGGGHDWPGSSGNMDIYTSEEIWAFFSMFIQSSGDVNEDGVINILDVIIVVSMILDGVIDLRSIRIVRSLRILRLLKLFRFNQSLILLHSAFSIVRREMMVFSFIAMILLYISSAGIYIFENPVQPDNFSSIFACMWWAVSTMTTVGYGDIVPQTVGGKIFTSMISFIGIGVVSIPTALLASSLTTLISRKEEE